MQKYAFKIHLKYLVISKKHDLCDKNRLLFDPFLGKKSHFYFQNNQIFGEKNILNMSNALITKFYIEIMKTLS